MHTTARGDHAVSAMPAAPPWSDVDLQVRQAGKPVAYVLARCPNEIRVGDILRRPA